MRAVQESRCAVSKKHTGASTARLTMRRKRPCSRDWRGKKRAGSTRMLATSFVLLSPLAGDAVLHGAKCSVSVCVCMQRVKRVWHCCSCAFALSLEAPHLVATTLTHAQYFCDAGVPRGGVLLLFSSFSPSFVLFLRLFCFLVTMPRVPPPRHTTVRGPVRKKRKGDTSSTVPRGEGQEAARTMREAGAGGAKAASLHGVSDTHSRKSGTKHRV